ncbi:MAG: lipopolysaccharide biosynthesis protein [Lachnospiraceae bacterium]|nr:lipopolysaccharide biosynthesis protein [Lachnospiraceae bacterium]
MSHETKALKGKIFVGLFWQYFQRIGSQAVSFIVSIILARLLSPSDFGTIALISVFIVISNVFIDSGFSNALIQRKEIDEIDTSSVFYTNIAISILLYLVIYSCSPAIAEFYNIPQLSSLLRVLSLQIILMALCCVQNALLVRDMKFKINFYVNISAVIISSSIGICCAYSGFGVWSLVYSQLAMQTVNVIGYWILVGWRPKIVFSFERIKKLFGYGSRILCGALLNVIYSNAYNLIIGKKYSSVDLGFYNRGQIMPTIIVENAANTINSVMFPALAKIQDDRAKFLSVVRRMMSAVAFIVFFIIALLFPLSYSIISLLLTDKWIPCVPYMQIVCITVCFTPFTLINSAILTSLGDSRKYLRATMISRTFAICLIAASSLVNIYFMVAMGSFAAMLSVFIMGFWNKQLINYSWKDFFCDIMPSFTLAIITSIIVFLVSRLGMSSLLTLIIGGVIGLIFYISVAFLFKFNQMVSLKEILFNRKNTSKI